MTYGEKLRNARKEAGFSQEELAEKMSVSRSVIAKWETEVYCGISYNVPFDLGVRSYGQYFRMRNYKDNSESFCGCFFDFDYQNGILMTRLCWMDAEETNTYIEKWRACSKDFPK